MIVFLDIDGVLNQLQGNYFLDKKCIENLGKLCKEIKGIVVLTSSWRLGYTNVGKCSPQIEELRKLFREQNISILGRTLDLGDRSEEIKKYIETHNVGNYVIIDDDISEFKNEALPNLYIVNHKTGLTDIDINKLVKLYKKS